MLACEPVNGKNKVRRARDFEEVEIRDGEVLPVSQVG